MYCRAGGSNFTLVRQNITDKKPVDSICMSWNIHPMQEISLMPKSWLKSLSAYNTELLATAFLNIAGLATHACDI